MRRSAIRAGLIVAAGLGLAGAALLGLAGLCVIAGWVAGWALLMIAALAIERWRYKPIRAAGPDSRWTDTGERFVDPETGKLVTVYHHPATGERLYVARGGECPAAPRVKRVG